MRRAGCGILLAAVAVAQPACDGGGVETTGATPESTGRNTHPEKPSEADLASRDWVLFSDLFEAMPVDGYPIELARDGTASSAVLSSVTGWRLTQAGSLELLSHDGVIDHGFEWLPAEGVFRACQDLTRDGRAWTLLIAPAGTSVRDDVLLEERLCSPSERAETESGEELVPDARALAVADAEEGALGGGSQTAPDSDSAGPVAGAPADEPMAVGGEVKRPQRISGGNREAYHELMASGAYAWSTCIVTAIIGRDGTVENVEILKPTGIDPEPERVIREMIAAWVFEPATLHDRPVAVRYNLVLHHCPFRARN